MLLFYNILQIFTLNDNSSCNDHCIALRECLCLEIRDIKVLPYFTSVERACLDYDLHFRVIHVESVQTHEGTRNEMTPRITDDISLGPNGNLQGIIRCFSLETGQDL